VHQRQWDRYTVFLRKVIHKRALRHLQNPDIDQDLSELVNELLTEWRDVFTYIRKSGNTGVRKYRVAGLDVYTAVNWAALSVFPTFPLPRHTAGLAAIAHSRIAARK
jgi:hypothetical protein